MAETGGETGLQLVELLENDYEEVLGVWRQAGLSVHPTGRESPEAFAQQMEMGRQRVVGIRTAAGRLIAVAVLTDDGRKGWINRLAVVPDMRRQGLAGQLITEAERWFTESLGLEVWAALIARQNAPSRALFAGAGFQELDVVYVTKRTRPDA